LISSSALLIEAFAIFYIWTWLIFTVTKASNPFSFGKRNLLMISTLSPAISNVTTQTDVGKYELDENPPSHQSLLKYSIM
jgi:hypothetical protein